MALGGGLEEMQVMGHLRMSAVTVMPAMSLLQRRSRWRENIFCPIALRPRHTRVPTNTCLSMDATSLTSRYNLLTSAPLTFGAPEAVLCVHATAAVPKAMLVAVVLTRKAASKASLVQVAVGALAVR